MTKIVAVIAAHTDDEALGCGGTIAKHVASGDAVHAIFLADGVTSRADSSAQDIQMRLDASGQAHRILGLASVSYLALPDNRLDSVPLLDIVQKLESALSKIQPEIVYTHHYGDLNVDHRITHQAVMTACRPVPGSRVREIYTFEVLSSTEWNSPGDGPFIAQAHVDISEFLDHKIAALEAYRLELRPAPHSRSMEHVRALAIHRGHGIGVHAAEAFMVARLLR